MKNNILNDILNKINWKVRFANKLFWITFIPQVLLVIQLVLALIGIKVDLGELGNELVEIVNAVFLVLATLGIVVDPTTSGVEDSDRAITYKEPK